MSIVLDGTTGLAGAATGALNGSLGATTPSTVAATTISASGVITATGGVVVGASAAPAFSAYGCVATTPTINTFTKVPFNTKYFDTNSNYDNATNYRFTPTVAGYYQVNCYVHYISAVNRNIVAIYKNGATYCSTDVNASNIRLGVSTLVYLNGSTDYIEGFTFNSNGGVAIYSDTETQLSASMVRSA